MSSNHEHTASYYVKIWIVLLVLLIISIVGPMFEIKIVTLITAFGIAVVKAAIVVSRFMHLNVERKIVWYILGSMLLASTLFYFGVAPDIQNKEGSNWRNDSAYENIRQHTEENAKDKLKSNAKEH